MLGKTFSKAKEHVALFLQSLYQSFRSHYEYCLTINILEYVEVLNIMIRIPLTLIRIKKVEIQFVYSFHI